MPPDNEEYYRLLQDANGELEEEIHMASQEIERLQAQLSAAKAALAVAKKEKKKMLKAGGVLYDVLSELYFSDLTPESSERETSRALSAWLKLNTK